jgi:enediyne polyketide synthase
MVAIAHRFDGKPEVAGERDVSVAHARDLTLALAGHRPVGCDIEPVVGRPDVTWQDLLGPDRFALAQFIARESREDLAAAATRVWTASECLKKAGALADAPLILATSTMDGWVVLESGLLAIATFIAPVQAMQEPLAFAILLRSPTTPLVAPQTGDSDFVERSDSCCVNC